MAIVASPAGECVSGKTMKLLRKTASKTKADYKLLKGAYKQAPAPLRAQGKRMMSDIVEVERQHKELAKNHPELGNGRRLADQKTV